jgi:hypothetical protein
MRQTPYDSLCHRVSQRLFRYQNVWNVLFRTHIVSDFSYTDLGSFWSLRACNCIYLL